MRNGSFIKGDTDVDIIIDAAHAVVAIRLLKAAVGCTHFVYSHHQGGCTPPSAYCPVFSKPKGRALPWRIFFSASNKIRVDIWMYRRYESHSFEDFHPQIARKVPNDVLFPFQSCDFEGMKVPCPRRAEQYLHSVYGDSWRIPSADKAKGRWYSHAYHAGETTNKSDTDPPPLAGKMFWNSIMYTSDEASFDNVPDLQKHYVESGQPLPGTPHSDWRPVQKLKTVQTGNEDTGVQENMLRKLLAQKDAKIRMLEELAQQHEARSMRLGLLLAETDEDRELREASRQRKARGQPPPH